MTISDYSNTIGLTESFAITPKKKLFVQTTFEGLFNKWTYNWSLDDDAVFQNTANVYSLPRLRLSYGLTNWMEVHLGASLMHTYVHNYEQISGGPITHPKPLNSEEASANQIDMYRVGVKFKILKQKGGIPNIALQQQFVYLYQDYYLPTSLLWGYSIGDRWNLRGDLTFNLASDWSDNYYHVELNEFTGSISANCDLIKNGGISVGIRTADMDFVTANGKFMGGWYHVSTGAYYRINDKLVLDAQWRGLLYNQMSNDWWKLNGVSATVNWMLF